MDEIATAFEQTLVRIGEALDTSFAGPPIAPRWGIAGFREETLVFLLAETVRALGWTCEYEQGYRDGTKRRGDLLATRAGSPSLWIEAKWWWFDVDLTYVLSLDKWKLIAVRGAHRPIAAVFTVDEEGLQQGTHAWTLPKAKAWLEALVPPGWRLVGCSLARSAYRGTSSREKQTVADRTGIFAAAFLEMVD